MLNDGALLSSVSWSESESVVDPSETVTAHFMTSSGEATLLLRLTLDPVPRVVPAVSFVHT